MDRVLGTRATLTNSYHPTPREQKEKMWGQKRTQRNSNFKVFVFGERHKSTDLRT